MAKKIVEEVPTPPSVHPADELLVDLFADLHVGWRQLKDYSPNVAERLFVKWKKIRDYLEAKGLHSEKKLLGGQ